MSSAKLKFFWLEVSKRINMIMDTSFNLLPWAGFGGFWDVSQYHGNSPRGRRTALLSSAHSWSGLCVLNRQRWPSGEGLGMGTRLF